MTEEIFDIVDENGQPAGGTVTRSQAHADGIRHRTAHIWGFEKWMQEYQACLPQRDEKFCVPMGGLEIVRDYVKLREEI